MPIKYETMTIKQAIDKIDRRQLLLPAIQRKFVWSMDQVCQLFDSILQEYPINTLMFWNVENGNIKKNYRFYEFLKKYCQRFAENNPPQPTDPSFQNFCAVIDGQQRLTSLYIGLRGTYAEKILRKRWKDWQDPSILPERRLHLDLLKPLNTEDEESMMMYDFRFLTQSEYERAADAHRWFCVSDILGMAHNPELKGQELRNAIQKEISSPLSELGLSGDSFAKEALTQLYRAVHVHECLSYCQESSQNIDRVLDVFIRTNHGGTKLEFADLLMSIAVANWDGDFRGEIDQLVDEIRTSNQMGFEISKDWILKACLMLIGADVKFKIKNFNPEQVEKIQSNWGSIKECIRATMQLVRSFGINEQSLTSTNAVMPICYYLFRQKAEGQALYRIVNNPIKAKGCKKKIAAWLYMALLRRIFGASADSTLSSMRNLLDDNLATGEFPLEAIIAHYKGTSKDLRFNEDDIENVLNTTYNDRVCRALLHLIFSEFDASKAYDIDHLHPQKSFTLANLKKQVFLQNDEKLREFYQNHWNSVTNLYLLEKSRNSAKGDMPLADWMREEGLSPSDIFADGAPLEFENFQRFYEIRREKLKKRLMSRVRMVTASASDDESDDGGE